MNQLTGAEAIVKSLRRNHVDTIFALPGGQLDHFFDALYKEDSGLRLISSRHEQGVAYMAYGYAKSTGKVGAYAVVPGPGLLNSTAALCTEMLQDFLGQVVASVDSVDDLERAVGVEFVRATLEPRHELRSLLGESNA